jgi:uncharacterized membrane protein
MSLKSVEMQIAIPRTNEAGVAQHQLSNKPTQDQSRMAMETLKKSELQRQQTGKVDDTSALMIREDERRKHSRTSYPSKSAVKVKKSADEETDTAKHPYKGRNFDVTL